MKAGTATFGASDKPLASEKLQAWFPIVVVGIVPVVNIDGIAPGLLKFDGKVLADIFIGKLNRWNDAEIAELNPGVALPAQPITIVHRLDGSGTTFNFTNFLSKSNPDWKTKVGSDTLVRWPIGIGGNGNDRVANQVNYLPGAIGYVELSYAVRHNMKYALVKNQAGAYVEPSPASFEAAAAGTEWKSDDFYEIITDAPGEASWPIAATTFVLMPKAPPDQAAGQEALSFFRWALENGQADARKLDYVPLPKPLVDQIEAYWARAGR